MQIIITHSLQRYNRYSFAIDSKNYSSVISTSRTRRYLPTLNIPGLTVIKSILCILYYTPSAGVKTSPKSPFRKINGDAAKNQIVLKTQPNVSTDRVKILFGTSVG